MNTRFLFLFFAVIAVASFAVRMLPHAPNFTPIGALALFAGAYLVPLRGISRSETKTHWWALFLPLLVMFVSDLFIGFYNWKIMAVVYAAFFGYAFVGRVAGLKASSASILLGSIGGAVLFYLTTNFAVWAFSPLYSHDLQGLLLSYNLALPFFRYTLLGDVFFAGVFFGAYALAVHYLFGAEKEKAII